MSSAQPLDFVAVLTPTREGVLSTTRRCISDMEDLGASRLDLAGCADVALARNLLLTHALKTAPDSKTVFLLVDDDMTFTAAQAQLLCERVRDGERPVSGVYATSAATLAHTRRPDGLWLSGLGFMAVRRAALEELAERLGTVKGINGTKLVPFCQCRPSADGSEWSSEDYWLCEQLGGVEMATLPITHHKRMPITPDLETLDRVAGVVRKES